MTIQFKLDPKPEGPSDGDKWTRRIAVIFGCGTLYFTLFCVSYFLQKGKSEEVWIGFSVMLMFSDFWETQRRAYLSEKLKHAEKHLGWLDDQLSKFQAFCDGLGIRIR